jgi:hypothetical protein
MLKLEIYKLLNWKAVFFCWVTEMLYDEGIQTVPNLFIICSIL